MVVQTIEIRNLPAQPTPFIGREPEIASTYQVSSINHTGMRALVIASLASNKLDNARDHTTNGLLKQLEEYNSQDSIQWLPIVATLLAGEGKSTYAVELLGLAFTHPDSILNWTAQWELFNTIHDDLKIALGDEDYQHAWEQGSKRDLRQTIEELLEYFDDDAETESHELRSQPLSEPLTECELEVLKLIADGLTNPQIAEKLYLSTGTVKVHTRNIYGKLDVSNRTEAATKARDLKLIG